MPCPATLMSPTLSIMGLIERIERIKTGFIPALTNMEIAWRIANRRVREELARANNTLQNKSLLTITLLGLSEAAVLVAHNT